MVLIINIIFDAVLFNLIKLCVVIAMCMFGVHSIAVVFCVLIIAYNLVHPMRKIYFINWNIRILIREVFHAYNFI